MSVDLGTQIRDYAQAVDTTQEPLSLDEITDRRLGGEPVRPIGLRPYPVELRPRRRWLVAVAAAVAVLAAVGGAALLVQVTEPDAPVVGTEVPTTLAESTPTTVAETTPTTLTESTPTTVAESGLTSPRWCEAPSTWTRVCDDAAGFEGAVLSSVTAGGPGLVAVGSGGVFDDELEAFAAVWTSPDGFTWTRVPHDESVFGGNGEQAMVSVTVGGPGLVAVGEANGDAAVWTSVDGFTWSRVPHDESVFGGDLQQRMLSVTVGGPGLVAVGADGTRDDDGFPEAVAAVWTSPDGFTWTRVSHDEAVFGGDGEQQMESVTVGGPGLVAVGWDGIGSGVLTSCCATVEGGNLDGVAAVWTSPDGFTWSRVPHDESVFGGDGAQAMLSVTVGGPGFVAVGATSGIGWPFAADAAVWTSADGFTWSRVPHDPAAFAVSSDRYSQDWMASVIAGGPGLVAVGSAGPVQGTIEEAMWTSPDGITWTLLPQSLAGCYGEMASVTAGGPGLVAVGFAGHCGPLRAAIWHD